MCRAVEIQPVAEGVLQQIAAELCGGDPLVPVLARQGRHVVASVVVRQVSKVHFVTLQEKTPPGRTIPLPAINHGSVRNDHGSGSLIGFQTGVLESRCRLLCDTGSGIGIREKTAGIAGFKPATAGYCR